MEFKSQVATNVEQSKYLLELGLKKETADCMYVTDERVPEEYRHYDFVPEYYESCLEGVVNIPAWSLCRLIEMSHYYDLYFCMDSPYDGVIDHIEFLIKNNEFNSEYLEEKQCK